MALTRTVNFRLPLPESGVTPWQQHYIEAAKVIDSILGDFVAIGGFLGAWDNSTLYSVGNKLVDTDTGVTYQCFVDHTSAASPTTFAQDRAARPTLWVTWSNIGVGAGTWQANKAYGVGDFVANGAQWAVCLIAHTSTTSFSADVALGYWSILVDLSAYSSVTFPITVFQGGTGATDAATARTNLGLVIGTNVQAYNGNLATIAAYPDVVNLSTLQGYVDISNLTALVNLTEAADKLPYFTGAGAMAVADYTGAARTFDAFTTAADQFGGIKQAATTAATGVVEIATQAEVNTGTDPTRSLTPETLTGWAPGVGTVTVVAADKVLLADASASGLLKQGLVSDITALATSGRVLLATQLASSSATIDFTTTAHFTDYDGLEIEIFDLVPATDDAELYLRFSTASTFQAASYRYTNHISYEDTDTPTAAQRSVSAAQILIGSAVAAQGVGTGTGEGMSATIKIANPSSTAMNKSARWHADVRDSSAARQQSVVGSGSYSGSQAAVDGIRFLMNTGNIASGRFNLYGIKRPS